MAAVEEMSNRLMKTAKELAAWDCPFSQILEEYHKLLEEQRDVNLNKAALVLQNSANVYVRRVEYLFQDTTALIRSFVDQEAANETEKGSKKNGKEKKTVIDIIDFEPIDFAQYVAKNNNIRNRHGAGNAVKLLGERFPQLESISRSSSKTDWTNANENEQEQNNSERKYDFRCNQYITAAGMLVEHLRPEDFSKCSSPQRAVNIPKESAPSAIDSSLGENEFASDTIPENVLDRQRCAVSTPLPDAENDLINLTFSSIGDSGRGSSIRDPARPESALSTDRDGNWDSLPPRPSSNLSIGEPDSHVEVANDSGIASDETPLTVSKRSADEHEKLNGSSKTNSPLSKSPTPVVEHCRRSKRLRSLFDIDKCSDTRPLEAIPFDNATDELAKSKRPFQLPCPASLLKCAERPHKRKKTSQARKRQRREKLLFNELENGNEKMNLYSPTRQLFLPFMKEELEDLSKCVKRYLRNLHDLEALKNYEAVMNESMNLLGYKTHQDRKSHLSRYETTDISGVTITSDIPDCADDFPMPDTPESFSSPEPMSPPPSTCETRIERLVHDIQENADVRTEQEEAVIRWHEKIQLKLRQTENKPKFEMADYTARVLRSLKNNNGRITFDAMVRQEKTPEAARYLLASLTLANKYDLRIDPSDDGSNVTLVLLKE